MEIILRSTLELVAFFFFLGAAFSLIFIPFFWYARSVINVRPVGFSKYLELKTYKPFILYGFLMLVTGYLMHYVHSLSGIAKVLILTVLFSGAAIISLRRTEKQISRLKDEEGKDYTEEVYGMDFREQGLARFTLYYTAIILLAVLGILVFS